MGRVRTDTQSTWIIVRSSRGIALTTKRQTQVASYIGCSAQNVRLTNTPVHSALLTDRSMFSEQQFINWSISISF